MDVALALIEIEALKGELEDACDALSSAALRGATLTAGTSASEVFAEILGLCAFQDLAGQRLDRLAGRITCQPADARPDAALLNGPANGDGLDQSAINALFGA